MPTAREGTSLIGLRRHVGAIRRKKVRITDALSSHKTSTNCFRGDDFYDEFVRTL